MAQYFVRWEASEMCAEVCPDGIFADILAQACAHFGVDPSRAALRHDGVQLDGDDRLCAAPFTPGTCLDLARRLGDDETCQVLGPFRLVRRQRRHSDDSVSGTSYQFEVSGPPNFTNLLGGYSGEDLCTAWGETEVGYRAAVLCETPGAPDVIRLRLSPCKGGEPTFVALDPEPPADVPDRYPQPVSEAKAASEAKAKAAVLARAAAAASAPASSSSSSSSAATQEEEEEEEEEGVHSRRSGPAEYFVRWGTAETRVEVDPSGVFADVLAQACAHFGVDPSRAALRHDGDEVVGAARLRTAQFGSGVLLDLALKKRQKKKKRNKEGQKREGEPAAAAAAASSSDARRAPVASGPFPSSGARRASTQQKVGPFRLTSSETHTRCADAVVAAYQFKVRGPAGFSPKGYTGVSSSSAWGYDDTGYCAARLVQDASLPDGVRLELTCCGTGKVESVVLCVDGTPDTAATATTDALPSPPLPLSQLQLPPQESDAEDAPAAGGAAGAAAPSPLQALPRRLPPLDGGAAAAPAAASSPPATAVEAVAAAAALQGPSPPPQPAPVKQSPAAARTTESVGGSGGGGAENLRRWETCVAPARPGDALPTVRFRRRLQG